MAGTYYPAYLRYATLAISSCTSSTTTGRATCSAVEPNNLASLVVQTCMQKREKSLRPTCQSAMRGTHVSQARRTTRYLRRQAMHGVGSRLSVCVARRRARCPRTARRRPCPVPVAGSVCPLPQWAERSREPGAGRRMAIRAMKMPRRSVCLARALVTRRRPLLCWSSGPPPSFPISSFPSLPLLFSARGRSAWATHDHECHRGYGGRDPREPLPRPATSAARAYGTRRARIRCGTFAALCQQYFYPTTR